LSPATASSPHSPGTLARKEISMALPSQTARTTYRRSHTFRSKHVLNGKVILAGLILAVVAIVVWVIIARRGGGTTSPPAAVTNDVSTKEPVNERNASRLTDGATSKREAERPTEAKTQATAGREQKESSRIVMGEDVPQLPVTAPASQPAIERKPGLQAAEPVQPQQPASTARAARSDDTNPTVTEQTSPQQPRAVTHAQRLLDDGIRQANAGRLVDARQTLSMALEQLDPYSRDAQTAREALGAINEVLVFSAKVAANDPYARAHKVQSGEFLSTIAKPLGVDWNFIARINGITDPSKMRAGQSLKVITGRFHAVVRKASYELDLYLGEGSDRVFVRTFKVGLGELDSTPVGRFAVASRVPNPDWKNPRTGEYFDRNDPRNPIGEFWVGMKGIEEKTRGMQGYGVHGTIDNDSIGTQASMGCVRMLPEDIALVYELLTNERNTIEIMP
jgi:LysM repeat protein